MLSKSLEFGARKLGFEFCVSELGLQKKQIVELNEYRVLSLQASGKNWRRNTFR